MDGTKIDFNALINSAVISGLKKDKNGKVAAEILEVFAKRGINALDAMAMLVEIMAIAQNQQNGGGV